MITYKKFKLDNGLRLIVHEDESTPMAAVNILYNVGAIDETAEKTGFAHLFEHLMFGGSVNIPDFDRCMQSAGGTSNAFTSSDITNYYDLLPAINLETALWLESDRMLRLAFSQQELDVQKKVVGEEFKQHYLNQPYGDVWHKILEMSYTEHPYGWPVIGKNLTHINNFILEDVESFFNKHYCPANAIITIAGGVNANEVFELVKKWFGDIPGGSVPKRNVSQEPVQQAQKVSEVHADVPVDALYLAFKMPARKDEDYYPADFITDILSNSSSSRLFQSLVKEQKLFSYIDAYITSSIEPGLIFIEGKLSEGIAIEVGEKAIWDELEKIKSNELKEQELVKVKHKIESHIEFSQNKILTRAMDLSYFELIGDTELINTESNLYANVSAQDIKRIANNYLKPEMASILKYYAKQN